MEASTAESADIRRQQEPEGQVAVRKAAARPPKDEATQVTALDWLLSDEPDETDNTYTMEINVGGAKKGTEKWISWTLQPVDTAIITRIRREANSGRQMRRGGSDGDNELGNRRILVAGTVEPNVMQAAKEKGIADPATLIEQRFSRKPGLVQQLVVEILALSGYDDDDVREARAAGNS